ncbi:MAG: N-acetyltransferase [Pseudomonadota bacterium]
MKIHVRPEERADQRAVFRITEAAFDGKRYADGTEAPIIDQLRNDGDLSVSLIAVVDGEVVGHVAFSPATIGEASDGWYGVGPVSVAPRFQRQGIGQTLMKAGLDKLRARNAKGCVLIGDPNYYGRFGFEGDCGLTFEAIAPSYVQRLAFGSDAPTGEICFAPAFYKF